MGLDAQVPGKSTSQAMANHSVFIILPGCEGKFAASSGHYSYHYFGLNDHFVGADEGREIVDIVPDVQIVDISHAVQAWTTFSMERWPFRRLFLSFPMARSMWWL